MTVPVAMQTNRFAGSTVSHLTVSTGELDKEALNFNDDTYLRGGFDANQELNCRGHWLLNYIKATADKINGNGDGVIGYVLCNC